jgi:hypothetical protein
MGTPSRAEASMAGPWIRDRNWDLTFIIGSGALVALPLLTYYTVAHLTRVAPEAFTEKDALAIAVFINYAVAGFIGGPHMYATFTFTLAERRFRRRFWPLLVVVPLIPAAVVWLAKTNIALLMTCFFTWASVHVLHQLVYIVRQYQMRAGPEPLPAWSRAIDYVLAFSCLYPIATWRLLAPSGSTLAFPGTPGIRQGFSIGEVDLSRQLPAAFQGQTWIAYIVWGVFGAALLAFTARTIWEAARRRLVLPRTLLLGVTVPIAFSIPMFDNMDVAFQGFNLWHSFQYLGLIYLLNAYRKERGEISSPLVAAISGFGNAGRYYATMLVPALGTAGAIALLTYGFGLPLLQTYYCIILSVLLVHYLLDHAVFLTQGDSLAPGRQREGQRQPQSAAGAEAEAATEDESPWSQ